jgi:DNA-binding transcriptional LysR family regulator
LPSVKSISQLDLNLLKVLEALYLQQNMTRAAEQLNITPSAVSHAMKRLREVLDDPLFVRQGVQMLPTPVCRRVVPEALGLLTQLRRTLQAIGEFEPELASQTIRLAIHDALEPLFFPQLIQLFAEKAPKLSLLSIKVERDRLPLQLESGQVDFAIDVARPLSTPIEHARLASSEFCLLVGSEFYKQSKMTEEAYGECEHITVSNRPTGKVLEDLVFAQYGFNRTIKVRCQNYQTAVAIVTQQPLVLTLPVSMARALKTEALTIMPLPFDVPVVETHLYWHLQNQSDSLLEWVGQTIQSSFN